MQIAYTMTGARGDTDLLLCRVAGALSRRGLRLAGAVQVNTARQDPRQCDMDIRIVPDGPVLRISQNLGAGARGCRLDTSALETAVALVSERLAGGCDLLLVNKFGKHEANGRGFRGVIADAICADTPVLLGVNELNHAAFQAFTAGAAIRLPARESALLEWAGRTVIPHLGPASIAAAG